VIIAFLRAIFPSICALTRPIVSHLQPPTVFLDFQGLTVWTIQFDKKKRLYNRQVYAGIRSIPRVSSIETCSTSLGDIDPCNLLKVQKQEKDQGQKEKKKKKIAETL
jgi:hypothetical protein